jgi:hypothetical protein
MKKIDTLKKKMLLPKPQTIQFILNFSKSVATIKMPKKVILVGKN